MIKPAREFKTTLTSSKFSYRDLQNSEVNITGAILEN